MSMKPQELLIRIYKDWSTMKIGIGIYSIIYSIYLLFFIKVSIEIHPNLFCFSRKEITNVEEACKIKQ